MTSWQSDEALVEMIDLYFRLSPAPEATNRALRTWLAGEIGQMPGRALGDGDVGLTRGEKEASTAKDVHPRSFGPSDWMESRDVAKYLKINVKTLANWRSLKLGPAFAKYGRILYRKADVDAWRESKLRRPDADLH